MHLSERGTTFPLIPRMIHFSFSRCVRVLEAESGSFGLFLLLLPLSPKLLFVLHVHASKVRTHTPRYDARLLICLQQPSFLRNHQVHILLSLWRLVSSALLLLRTSFYDVLRNKIASPYVRILKCLAFMKCSVVFVFPVLSGFSIEAAFLSLSLPVFSGVEKEQHWPTSHFYISPSSDFLRTNCCCCCWTGQVMPASTFSRLGKAF